jgi:hypothetical protein
MKKEEVEILDGMTLGNDLKTWTFKPLGNDLTHPLLPSCNFKPHNTNKIYYVENTELINGDTMSFWKQGNCGYTTNLNEAVMFDEDHEIIKNIIRDQKLGVKKYRLWNVDYLRKAAILSVNRETIDLINEK